MPKEDSLMETKFKDFCPLCGYRFRGKTPEEVSEKIIAHAEDGTCFNNFRPFEVVLSDIGNGPGRGYYELNG